MTLPNFLCVGVQRAATTWLHRCLSVHPDVYLSEQKELHFFNHNYERGMEWYESRFKHAGTAVAVGEITPNYLHTAPIERIHSTLPEARIVVILREPVSRAYSAFRLLNEKFADMSFEQACESELGSYLIRQSLYADRLEELFSYYPREQVLVLLYDDVNSTPAKVYRDVCEHLGVKQVPLPDEVNQTFNHIMFPRTQTLLGRLHMGWVVNCVKKTPLGDTIKRFSKQQQVKQVSTQQENRVSPGLREQFDQDIKRVEELTGLDLSQWLSHCAVTV